MELTNIFSIFFNLTIILLIFNWANFRSSSVTWRFFHRQIKYILKPRNAPYYALHGLYMFFYLLYIVRFVSIIYQISLENLSENAFKHLNASEHSFFYLFFCQLTAGKDYFYILIFIMFYLNGVLLEPKLFLTDTQTFTWQKNADLVVANNNAFQRIFGTSAVKEKNNINSKNVQNGIVPQNVNKLILFSHCKLANLPLSLSVTTRVRYIKLGKILDKVILYSITFCGKKSFYWFLIVKNIQFLQSPLTTLLSLTTFACSAVW